MAKATRRETSSTKARASSSVKSRATGSVAKPSARVAAETNQPNWATDLIFGVREPKLAVSLRLDADVLRFFRAFGSGYQTRINEVLKAFMHARVGSSPAPVAAAARARSHNGNASGKRPRVS